MGATKIHYLSFTSALKLKQLPSHFWYAYLEKSSTLLVIIANKINKLEEQKLLRVLWDHKTTIGRSIVDIRCVNTSMCMHNILMKDKYRPSVKNQHRFNLNMTDVIWAEVIKLLDARTINLISNYKYVSLVQVMPKKWGITMVKNVNNKLIPTSPITG